MIHHTVAAPATPLYLLGWDGGAPRARHMRQSVLAPKTPLYLQGYLGADASKAVGASAAPAGAATSAVITSAASSGAIGAGWGAWAGPIGAAVGVGIGLVAGLLAKHALRAKQAKNENSAVNIGVSGFDSDLQQIQQAFKAGQLDANGAMQAIEQVVMPGYWTVVSPQMQPGRNGCNSGSGCPPDTSAQGKQPCVGNIGAACCVGCYQLEPSISGPNGVLAALSGQSGSSGGPHTADIHIVAGSKYGATTRGAYTLDFTPPASAASSVDSSLSTLFSGGTSGSSLLPLLLLGAVGFLALR